MIAIESLTKRFGSSVAVDDLSFTVEPGSVLGFLGPNGAGKTTTLRVLLGLAHASSGSATIDGRAYTSLPQPTRTVGAVLDTSGFHPGRKGRNHLRVVATEAGLPRSRVEEVLKLVELEDAGDRRVKGYSLGMKQRLNLAGALLGDPQVLILDEPANGLDPQGIRWLRDFLRSMAGEGRTVLISSHVLAEVSQTVDQVVVIHKGRLRAHSTLEELTHQAGGSEAATRVRSPDASRLAELLSGQGTEAKAGSVPDGLLVSSPPERVGELAAENGIVLHELTSSESSSLEDVFFELTGEGEGVADEGEAS